jgi:hypothetical protein
MKFLDIDALPSESQPRLVHGHGALRSSYSLRDGGKDLSLDVPPLSRIVKEYEPTNVEEINAAWVQTKIASVDGTESPPWPTVKPTTRLRNLIILTTSRSYQGHVTEAFTRRYSEFSTRRKRTPLQRSAYMGEIGSVIIDECHKEKGIQSHQIHRLLELAQQRPIRPFIWALSGTFVQTGPQDVAGYCAALRGESVSNFQSAMDQTWEKNPKLRSFNSTVFVNLSKSFKSYMDAVGSGKPISNERLEEYRRTIDILGNFIRTVMISRHEECMWPDHETAKILGIRQQPCKKMPPIQIEDVWGSNPLTDEVKNLVERVEQNLQREIASLSSPAGGKSKADALRFSAHGQKARLCGTLPFIALYNDLALTQEAMNAVIKATEAKQETPLRLVSDLVHEHASLCWKLGWLSKLIGSCLGPSPYHPGGNCKLVIVAKFPGVTRAVHEVRLSHCICHVITHSLTHPLVVHPETSPSYHAGPPRCVCPEQNHGCPGFQR